MIEKIMAVIVDDEPNNIETLSMQLQEYCHDVEVVNKFDDPEEAIDWISKNDFDLLFLDIQMPGMTGFELIDALAHINFQVIFVTAYEDYSIRAFKYAASDYLLKPVPEQDLVLAVDRVIHHRTDISRLHLLERLINYVNPSTKKLALPTLEGISMVMIENILAIESSRSYSNVVMENGSEILICRNLKECEVSLRGFNHFVRIHSSAIINTNLMQQYVKGSGGYVVMNNGKTYNVSKLRKNELLQALNLI